MAQTDKKLNILIQCSLRLISLVISGLVFFSSSARAMTLIYDEETEKYLQEIIAPLYHAVGLSYDRHKVFVLQDNSLNAFVSDGNNLFIHTETILKAQTDDELRGIIAHEAGHIQGGHILRQKLRLHEMQNISLTSMVLAGALGVASGRGDVAAAIALGTHSSLLNQSLAYQVQEERNADEAAVSILNKTHHSPYGLLKVMKKIQQQSKLQGIDETVYFRTHPMSSERLAFLEQSVKKSPYPPQTSGSEKLKRIQAKLYAFIKSPQQTNLKYPASDDSLISCYARSIAAFKNFQFNKAKTLVDRLITQEPNNPHFRELKGQILYELGQLQSAQKEFSYAIKLSPNSDLFKINEAQVVLELSPTPIQLRNVIIRLQQALRTRQSTMGWLLLSRAYHLNKQEAEALYASAQYSLSVGNKELAYKQAQKAKALSLDPKLTLKIEDLMRLIQ